jgi:hypothetical protein
MWFSRPTIQIHVSPDHWTFTCEARSWSGATVVYLDQLSAQGMVMAIGTAPPGGASCVPVPKAASTKAPFWKHSSAMASGRS